MTTPTISEALAALDANPQAGREFDKASATEAPGMTRRAAVQLAIQALGAKQAATASAGRAGTLKERAKAAQAELERAHRALTAPKAGGRNDPTTTSVEEGLRHVREGQERERKQRERERRAQARPASPAKPTQNLRPFENDNSQALVFCLRKKYFVGRQAEQAAEELARRNVTIHARGYSISARKTN